jgi:hypothetical protein
MNDAQHHDWYQQVYEANDPTPKEPHGWIQWKGTNVCIDLRCSCGYLGHVDAEFFYFYECNKCHAKYAVGQNVKLIPLTQELIALGECEDRFIKGDL